MSLCTQSVSLQFPISSKPASPYDNSYFEARASHLVKQNLGYTYLLASRCKIKCVASISQCFQPSYLAQSPSGAVH